jgi:hypothetical protein
MCLRSPECSRSTTEVEDPVTGAVIGTEIQFDSFVPRAFPIDVAAVDALLRAAPKRLETRLGPPSRLGRNGKPEWLYAFPDLAYAGFVVSSVGGRVRVREFSVWDRVKPWTFVEASAPTLAFIDALRAALGLPGVADAHPGNARR